MLSLALRFVRRELRGGLKGFRLFLACLALGVGAIAAVGSVTASLMAGLAGDARAILGGDVEVQLIQRDVTDGERDFLARFGRLSHVAELRAMAVKPGGADRTLVELKAADAAYPLIGTLAFEPEQSLSQVLAGRGAAIEPTLASRLGIGPGDTLSVGDVTLEIRALLSREPDKATGAFTFGPRVLVSFDTLQATGLLLPGSLVRHEYRLMLAPGITVPALREAASAEQPQAGWRIRAFDEAAPGLRRFLERIGQYLTLVGLTALLVGGVGVGNAVRSYLDGKLPAIATLKALGAPARLAFTTYLILVLVMATGGILAGLALGAITPMIFGQALAAVLPIQAKVGLYWQPLAVAAACGLFTTLAFAFVPLARASQVAPGDLFRAQISPPRRFPGWLPVIGTAAAFVALSLLMVATAQDRWLALWFLLGSIGSVFLFYGTATAIAALARRAGRPSRPLLRLALANLTRPGSPMGALALSLGLGLTVLVAVALIERNLDRQVNERLPERAPTFFFIDIQPDQAEAFDRLVTATPGASDLSRTPMIRGRVASVNGVPADQVKVEPGAAWALRGDRGFSYARQIPANARLVEGKWWPADYSGPPLVSMDVNIARGLGIGIGDRIGLNVLGRVIEAEIASLREIDWGTLSMNFTFIFAPGALDRAPQTHLATVHLASAQEEGKLLAALGKDFPNVSAVRVKDAIDAANRILEGIAFAVRVTAAVTLAAGTLVLAGAVAAGHRRRVKDAVVLKVLGARRAEVLGAYLLEFGLLGLVIAAIAAVAGTVAGWAILVFPMRSDFVFSLTAVAGSASLSVVLTVLLGLIGTWHALGQKAAPMLRDA
ncbi:MAG: FtsX-like permease family protein [Alphaproteobacteria bacterium]|nr:FtsX-like permease family protein [Alphaproteobacteria bacterium]